VLRAEHEAARNAVTAPDDTDQLWSTMELAGLPAPRHARPPTDAEPDHTAHDGGLVDELERLARLRDAGALSDVEFQTAKSRLLG